MLKAQSAYNHIFKKNISDNKRFQTGCGYMDSPADFVSYLVRNSPAYPFTHLLKPIYAKYNRIPILHLTLSNNEYTNYVTEIASLSHPISLIESSKMIMNGGGKRKPPMMLPIILYDSASINLLKNQHYRSNAWRNHLINNWIIQTKPNYFEKMKVLITPLLRNIQNCSN